MEESAEDEKFVKSLENLARISADFQRIKENEKSAEEPESEEKQPDVPFEQHISPADRIEPLKSMVPPEYVKKVIREKDTMTKEMLREALERIKVSTSGNLKTLRKRVALYYRKENMLLNRKLEPNADKTAKFFDYLIAIDFECTCVAVIYDYPHEIIELPAVLIDVREMKVISEFRTYVRPVRNPILSEFCIDFTKITQETVDNAPYFREALLRLYTWMRKYGLGEKNSRFAFVTDGPHDMWKFMQFQCMLSNIRMPHMFRSFINVKKTFKERFNGLEKGNGKSGIENMLARLGLAFRGNKHSGLDDARNIAQIAISMMAMKIELRINQKCSYKLGNAEKEHNEELEDLPDLKSADISRRDFQQWMRRLPLKLMSVTRREFINEEHLDCDSCDELTDDKTDDESLATKMAIRKELETIQNAEFEKLCHKNGHFVIGETPKKVETGRSESKNVNSSEDVDESDDEDDDDDDDLGAEFENLEFENSQPTEIELSTVWERENSEKASAAASSSVIATSSSENSSETTPEQMVFPPKNSLASSNRRYF